MEWAVFGSILMMGFLGSWHCGVMCGPLSCNFKAHKDFVTYHLGRLVSYLVLSSLLYFGIQYFLNVESRSLKLAASVFFGIIFIYFGLAQLNLFSIKRFLFKYYKFQFLLLDRFKNLYKKFPVLLGLLTGLFPCGWLYSFLLLSSQMKSWSQASLVVVLFWLTSLPAFLVFTGFMQGLVKNSPIRYQTLSGVVLIVAGVLSILGHWSSVLSM